MASVIRDIAAEGIASIVRALPEDARVVLQIGGLSRDKFDQLRGDQEATYVLGIWMALVPMGDDVWLDIMTTESPQLRAVS